MVSFYPPFLLSLSPPSFSLWLQDTCHLMPFTKYPLLNQSYFFTPYPYPSIAHKKFTNHSPTIFYDHIPSSELLEKHLFRSRANRRLVFCNSLHGEWFFATVQRGFFATVSRDEGFLRRFNGFLCDSSTVQRFFLQQFRRVKKRSGWYSVHRSGSGATLSVVAVVWPVAVVGVVVMVANVRSGSGRKGATWSVVAG